MGKYLKSVLLTFLLKGSFFTQGFIVPTGISFHGWSPKLSHCHSALEFNSREGSSSGAIPAKWLPGYIVVSYTVCNRALMAVAQQRCQLSSLDTITVPIKTS